MARLAGELSPLHPVSPVLCSKRRAWSFPCGRPALGAAVLVGSKPEECSPASSPAFPEGPRLPWLRALRLLLTRSLRRQRRRGPEVGARLPLETMRPRGEAARTGPGLDRSPGGLAAAGSLR